MIRSEKICSFTEHYFLIPESAQVGTQPGLWENIVKMADLLRRPASYNHETRGDAFQRGRLAFSTKKEANQV